jgi:cysteinyl-tRNA synthetase
MSFQLYNTLTNKKEQFEPVEAGKVGIYVCGPTVYKESHIGHAVGPVIFDALKKYLTHKEYQVTLVINITDVDDKILNEAKKLGVEPETLAKAVSESYFGAMKQFGVTSVDYYPRATEHIGEIIKLIQRLGENGAAYAVDGDVYFDITRSKDYGKLSNRTSEDQREGTRQLSGTGKRNSGDFALWKGVEAREMGWESPWGYGRPGWHIECSAMSMKYLGETFDIHGGGMDLIFPHHENEVAQSETATGKPFVKYWMHNGLTRVRTKASGDEWKTEKMSKSLGNIRTLSDLLSRYPGPILRLFLLSTHYRRPIDFSDEAIAAVQKGALSLYRTLERVGRLSGEDVYQTPCSISQMEESAQTEADKNFRDEIMQSQLRYLESLDDDFNTAGAIAVLHDLCGAINRYIDGQHLETQKNHPAGQMALARGGARMVTALGRMIGLLEGPLPEAGRGDDLSGKLMEILIEVRRQARQDKQFKLSDAIRDQLKQIDITLEDRPDGSTTWKREMKN